ncbi:hypothetical protein HZH68_014802 [Vespula germanica]|uniref:Uncharacterized protein n=1 Tax=Vespula germanica TaxID=30212 RepID=A0A834MSW7_VESGE|nr:hypothetical protein HZH68_014802 [Vespula germanica]
MGLFQEAQAMAASRGEVAKIKGTNPINGNPYLRPQCFPPYKFHHKSSNHHHSINKQPRHLRQEQQRRQLPLNKFSHQDSQLKQ